MKRAFCLAAITALLQTASAAAGCTPYWTPKPFTNPSGLFMVTADFDDDGRSDVATASRTSAWMFLTNATTSQIGTPVQVATGDYYSGITALDATGDEKLDLLLNDIATNALIVLPGNGDGTFGAAIATPTLISPTELVTGDFNGDTIADVAFRSYSASTIAVWKGDGDGTFTELARTALTGTANDLAAADLDGDDLLDLVVSYESSSTLRFFSGNGNGTFDASAGIAGGHGTFDIDTADLDDDGDIDIATVENPLETFSVLLNNGGGTFAPVVQYSTLPGSGDLWDGDAFDLELGDVTQDGIPDAVIALGNDQYVATAVGDGGGSFVLSFTRVGESITHTQLGNVDTDEKRDLFLSGPFDGVGVAANNCGDIKVFTSVKSPLITVGDTARVQVWLNPAGIDPSRPEPTGSISIYEGPTLLTTVSLEPYLIVELPGLSVGTHVLQAVYSGDDHYHTASAEFTQNVTSESTTVTVATADTSLTYGEQFVVTVEVTGPDGEPAGGELQFFIDGEPGPGGDYLFDDWRGAGTHTYQARYYGNATTPAASSNILTVTIAKDSIQELNVDDLEPVRAGSPITIDVEVYAHNGGTPTGVVALREGNTVVGSAVMTAGCCSGFNHAEITLPAMSVGVHTLRAIYEGDANHLAFEGLPFTVSVFPNEPFPFAVRGGASIRAEWIPLEGQRYYRVLRRVSGAWQEIGGTWGSSFEVQSPQSGVVYVLKVEAYDSPSSALIASSNADLGMLISFTDDPLLPGTKAKALHVTQLVSAANALRAAAGLAPITLPSADVGQIIRASHVTDLRAAVNQARVALGTPAVSFEGGSVIKAIHMQQLRDAFR